jgi:cation diffusion facilitator CzcD-associated flavoprotein CzcO/acetyl esterase/lipase
MSTDSATSTEARLRERREDVDVVVVGAGFSGLYLLHRLRELGFSTRVIEAADDVGGTWYWNRYPGARCDIPSTDYAYSFDPALEDEWTWSEKYATQPELLAYLQFVADRYDLRRDIEFGTSVVSAAWDEPARRWRLHTSRGDGVSCGFYVMATGCMSMPHEVDIEGADRFAGEVYQTGRWPHEGVDLRGKRVAVISTGSSGIQAIPLIAEQAEQLTVFQRAATYSIPAHNGPPPADAVAALAADRAAYRAAARRSRGGIPMVPTTVIAAMCSEDEQRVRFEEAWAKGTLLDILDVFADQGSNPAANEVLAGLIRAKIRSIVRDPETAESLCPTDHPLGARRPCLDTDYFDTYNRPDVRLVDLRRQPITTITETGIDTLAQSFEIDAIVYATGFDVTTGAVGAVDITGRAGLTLARKWAEGPTTYLGLTTVGFPNLFMIAGPGSPSVLSNMAVSIEQQVDWIADRLADLRRLGFDTIEPTPVAEAGWVQHVDDCADITLYPTVDSWYTGANVPGKPRVFLPYIGGVGAYRAACEEVVENGYLGFRLEGPSGTQCNDGVIRRLQPDVAVVLETVAALGLPPVETLSPGEARAFSVAAKAAAPPGPEVGEIVDGVLPGAGGDLRYRLFRPSTTGPHPIVAYFHGGGWVLGAHDSDAPFCRDLCVRADVVVVSVDYRHAPEHRFPAAVEDAFAAVQWIGGHAVELGGVAGQLAVAGYSAGGNLATVACRMASEAGGPGIVGQLLINPVTDSDLSRRSYVEYADGYVLTRSVMEWFFDQYVDPAERGDPRVSPLRAGDLSRLPPAVVVTCEFDPLRDEGDAYADALEAAGVPTRRVFARGHTHTSLAMVGIVLSGARPRAEISNALRDLFKTGDERSGHPVPMQQAAIARQLVGEAGE